MEHGRLVEKCIVQMQFRMAGGNTLTELAYTGAVSDEYVAQCIVFRIVFIYYGVRIHNYYLSFFFILAGKISEKIPAIVIICIKNNLFCLLTAFLYPIIFKFASDSGTRTISAIQFIEVKNYIYISTFACAILISFASCRGPRRPPKPVKSGITYVIKDSLLEGLCGSNTTTDTLDLVVVGYDPLLLDMREAWKAGRILGAFDVGDKVKLKLCSDLRTVKGAIDMTSLCRPWMQRDSTAQLPCGLGLSLTIDGSASMINAHQVIKRLREQQEEQNERNGNPDGLGSGTKNPMEGLNVRMYSKWHIVDGNIILTAENMFAARGASQSDTLRIEALRRDSLVLRTMKGKIFGTFSPETPQEMKSETKR